MTDMEINKFINKENKKYINCLVMMMHFYLKSSNEKINIVYVAKELGGNFEENLVLIKRILRGLNKKIYFNFVSLSYSDYLKMEEIVRQYKTYIFQLFPYIISVFALVASLISLFLGGVADIFVVF